MSFHTQPGAPSLLEQLPEELQLLTFQYLSYVEAIRLLSVNRHFNRVAEPHKWPVANKESSLYDAQTWSRYNKAYFDNRLGTRAQMVIIECDGYACFSCYRILDRSKFSRNQTEGRLAKGSLRNKYVGHTRFCIDCGIKKGYYLGSTFFSIVQALVIQTRRSLTSDFHYSTKEIVVCPNCMEAHGWTDKSTPDVCNGCQKAQIEYDGSDAGQRTLYERQRGLVSFECEVCRFVSTIRSSDKVLYCFACEDSMCRRCYEQVPHRCRCNEVRDPLLAVRVLFKTEETWRTKMWLF